ncbi:MAG: acyltransferase family protein [Anaerolineales bacterium]|nr:acyltransferase family protein [Anaerolineales bacterium]
MSDQFKRRLCTATTQAGAPCKNLARPGSAYCHVHQLQAAAEPQGQAQDTPAQLQRELAQELDELVSRLRQAFPAYEPPPFSPSGLLSQLRRRLPGLPGPLQRLRESLDEDLFHPDTLRGLWYLANYSAQRQADFVKRRLTGEFETDAWGLDWEFVQLVRPFFEFLYERYWRIEMRGLEHIPARGRALLVCNHSGQLPWDGAMLATGIYNHHQAARLVRSLYDTWFSTLPFFSTILERGGQVLATVENGTRLLEQEELVAVFPEGVKGVGKLFKDRYRLARFGRGGFVRMALDSRAAVIPVSIVGAEETYISLAKSELIARMIDFPIFPISITWPWLGPLGFVPLPTKWYIDIGAPLAMDGYEPQASSDLVLVSKLTDQVRNTIQEMVNARLSQRKSVFFG